MKTILAVFMLCAVATATSLTGTLLNPLGGGPATGTLVLVPPTGTLLLVSCGGFAGATGPTAVIRITVTAGALVSPPAVTGNDCLSPTRTEYAATFTDSAQNVFVGNWAITGSSMDISTLPLGVRSTIQGMPQSHQYVWQPNSTYLHINSLNVYGALLVPHSTVTPTGACTKGSIRIDDTSNSFFYCPGGTSIWTAPSGGGGGGGISSLNGLTLGTQLFANDTNVQMVSSGATHTITWAGTLAKNRQHPNTLYSDGTYPDPAAFTFSLGGGRLTGFGSAAAQNTSAFEVPLTFNNGLNRATNTIGCVTANGSTLGCISPADWATFNNKQAALGFTAENVANKSTDVTLGGGSPSNTLYPSQNAVQTYVLAHAGGGSGSVVLTTTAGPPSAACTGPSTSNLALNFDTTNNNLYYCNKTTGPVWRQFGDDGAGSGKSGAVTLVGLSSGGKIGFSIADASGNNISYVLPTTDGTTGQVLTDNGVVTCPTLATGAPTVCHQLVWVPATSLSGFSAIAFSGATSDLIGSIADGQLSGNIPLLNGTNAYTGTQNSSGATKTLPNRTGTGSPVGRDACATVGETYFQSNATAGQNVFGCTATGTPGTWNLEGDGGLPAAVKVRTCEIIIGDPGAASPALVDDNDSPAVCGNKTGATLTITAVECYANAGSPTVTPIITGGGAILTGALTCGTASFASGTLSGTPTQSADGTIDANITTAGGTAKYIVIRITRTL